MQPSAKELAEADILLIRPRSVERLALYPGTPNGLLQLSAYLATRGFAARVLDLDCDRLTPSLWKALAAGKPRIVGISMLSYMRRFSYRFVRRLKALSPGTKIVLGGVHPSAIPLQLVGGLPIDAVVVGEGEESLADLMDVWARGQGALRDVRGVATPEHGLHPPRLEQLSLDTLPVPDYAQADLSLYRWPLFSRYWPSYTHKGFRVAEVGHSTIMTSRGCIGRCFFCNHNHWKGFRARSTESVMRELEALYARGVKTFNFNDECFGQDIERALELCDAIIASGMNIAWQTAMRVELANERLLERMHAAGCLVVAFGIESGSPKILRNLNKRQTPEQALLATRAAKRVGLKTFGLIMVGSPGETDDTIGETIAMMKEMELDLHSALGRVLIYPGTALERIGLKKGMLNSDYWLTEADGLPVFLDNFTLEDCERWTSLMSTQVPWRWKPETP